MTTVATTAAINESQAKDILDSISEEFYRATDKTKKEYIKLAVKKLEEIDIPREMIGGLLVKYLRFASESYIYDNLGPEYKRHFDKSGQSPESGLFDDNNELEEDAKKVKERYGITDNDLPDELDDPVVKSLKKKLGVVAKRCYYFEDQYYHFKSLFEAGIDSGAIKSSEMLHEITVYSDDYEQLSNMMKKSPNGLQIVHDGYNTKKFKAYKFHKPLIGVEN